jgi:hypothetical protein
MSEGMLAQAQARSSTVQWAFHFFDPPAALREFFRALGAGGLAAVATIGPLQPLPLLRLADSRVNPAHIHGGGQALARAPCVVGQRPATNGAAENYRVASHTPQVGSRSARRAFSQINEPPPTVVEIEPMYVLTLGFLKPGSHR